jgi:hypothetical protein
MMGCLDAKTDIAIAIVVQNYVKMTFSVSNYDTTHLIPSWALHLVKHAKELMENLGFFHSPQILLLRS